MLLINDKGGEDGEEACCRDVSVYNLHTMTSVSPDQVVCDEKYPAGSKHWGGAEADKIWLLVRIHRRLQLKSAQMRNIEI